MDPLAVGDKAGQLLSANGLYGIISVLCGVIIILAGVIAYQYRTGVQKDKTLFDLNGRVSDMLGTSKTALTDLSNTIGRMNSTGDGRFDTVKSMSDQIAKLVFVVSSIAEDVKKIEGVILRELFARGRQ